MISILVGLAIAFRKDAALLDFYEGVAMLQRKHGTTDILVTFATKKMKSISFVNYGCAFLSSLALFLKYLLNKILLCIAFKFSFKS